MMVGDDHHVKENIIQNIFHIFRTFSCILNISTFHGHGHGHGHCHGHMINTEIARSRQKSA